MKPILKVGLIAVWKEAEPLLNLMSIYSVKMQSQLQFHIGQLAGQDAVLAQIGMGKVPAAVATQHLIDIYNVDLLISCGSAGAFDSSFQVGDLILADKIVLHDFGQYTDDGFRYLGILDNNEPDGLHYHRHLAADPKLLAVAQQSATTLKWPTNVPACHTGVVASGDQIIASARKKRWLADTFNAIAVEMESGAMAQVALMNNIPWLAIRAISDQADSSIDINLSELITYSDEPKTLIAKVRQTGSKVAQLAKHPNHLKAILQIRKGVQQASQNAARLTTEVVSRLVLDVEDRL